MLLFLLQRVSSYCDTTLFNYIRSLTCFICFISTLCKTLRMSVFNKELLAYLLYSSRVHFVMSHRRKSCSFLSHTSVDGSREMIFSGWNYYFEFPWLLSHCRQRDRKITHQASKRRSTITHVVVFWSPFRATVEKKAGWTTTGGLCVG